MAITKLGQAYIEKTATNVSLLNLIGKVIKAPLSIGRAVVSKLPFVGKATKGTYSAAKGIAETALKGADKTGKFLAMKPAVAIPVLGVAATGAFTLNDKIKRNMLHTDPRMNVTMVGSQRNARFRAINPNARTGIRYHNEQLRNAYKDYNPYF